MEREVLLQFLIEAVVLAALGGLMDILLAAALSSATGIPCLFDPGVNLLSFLFSAGIGVLFGYFPARVDPIDALRHE